MAEQPLTLAVFEEFQRSDALEARMDARFDQVAGLIDAVGSSVEIPGVRGASLHQPEGKGPGRHERSVPPSTRAASLPSDCRHPSSLSAAARPRGRWS